MSADEAKKSTKPVGDKEIQLYSLGTPNGMKIPLFLEEAGVPYDAHTIPISGPNALQFTDWFIELNPNSKIPVITDLKGPEGKPFNVFESGAILVYLAEKYGKFLSKDAAGRSVTLQWLFFQVGGVGPMLGQMNHFFNYAPEDVPYAKNRYKTEVQRLLGVVEKRLATTGAFLAGSEYTIADMANYPWINNLDRMEKCGVDVSNIPNIRRWLKTIDESMSADEAKKSTKPIGDKEIQLYSLATPNGVKIALFLEEAGIPYDAHTIPISGPNALQFTDWFIELNPNSKIPVITDLKGPEGKPFNVFESGAILVYLAEKYGKFLPKDAAGRSVTLQWLFFQVGGIGPMMGQVPYAKNRYKTEVQRLLGVVEKRLAATGAYLAGSEYTIADMANYPWINNLDRMEKTGLDLSNIPNIRRWLKSIDERPATEKAKKVTSLSATPAPTPSK